jgi:predicted nucleic acid-binding protein
MIVVDAGAWFEIATGSASPALADLVERDAHWAVPEHFRVEVLNAGRGRLLGGHILPEQLARIALELVEARFDVWPTAPLIPRIVQLTPNATPYDAAYVALAEELGCALVTVDAKLSRVPGIRCRVTGFAE